MRTLQGHVFQPLVPWLRERHGIPLEWNGRAKLRPDLDVAMEPWLHSLEKLEKGMARRIFGREFEELRVPKVPVSLSRVAGEFTGKSVHVRRAPAMAALKGVRDELRRNFAIPPIDKFAPDALEV